MDKPRRLLAHLTLVLLGLAPQSGWSRPVSGQLSDQSRASIDIRVSVLPRFQVEEQDGAFQVTSNAHRLRYDLVRSPTPSTAIASPDSPNGIGKKHSRAEQEFSAPRPHDGEMVMVVPD